MKRFNFILSGLLCLLVFTACSSTEYVERKGDRHIEIFRDGAKPTQPFRELVTLTDDGSLGEQGDIEGKFLRKARKFHADAVIMQPLVKTGGELKGLQIVDTFLFKATVIEYTQKAP